MSTSQDLLRASRHIEHLTREFGTQNLVDAARELREKIEQSAFYLVIVGQFKRGKTTFINALLGEPVLPVALLPLTSVVTILHYGEVPAGVVHFESGKTADIPLDRLAEHVTETGNPKNVKGVSFVDVFYPCPVLDAGLIIVDTPGIASIHSHNTKATYAFLPRIDASIFVTSPEPPITAAEIGFLEDLRQHVAKIYVVMNKADLPAPEGLAEIIEFTKLSLQSYLCDAPFFTVSARLALDAKQKGERAALDRSGLAEFESELGRFVREERYAVFRQSATARLLNLIAEFRALLSLRMQALQTPVLELREKSAALDQQLSMARLQQQDNEVLLKSSLSRLAAAFDNQAKSFAAAKVGTVREAVQRVLERSRSLSRRQLAANVDRVIADAVRDSFDEWRRETEPSLIASFRETTARFELAIGELAAEVRKTAGDLFNVAMDRFVIQEDLVYVESTGYCTDTLLDWGLGNAPLLLPGGLYRSYVSRRAMERVRRELERNATRVSYDFKRRLNESASRFQQDLNRKLSEMIENIRCAIQTALDRSQASAQQSEQLVNEVERSLKTLEQLRSEISGGSGLAVTNSTAGKF